MTAIEIYADYETENTSAFKTLQLSSQYWKIHHD